MQMLSKNIRFVYLIFSVLLYLNGAVEKWGQFELVLSGPSDGNPFVDNQLFADFSNNDKKFHVRGFYDDNGIYKIRFMPTEVGEWSYITNSNVKSMNQIQGTFNVTAATGNNQGPVVVDKSNNKSFIYLETGETFFQTGTTSYAWIHETTYNETLKTIKYVVDNNIFNKIRMTIFPKWYPYTYDEPVYYPYQGIPPNNWGNFDKFNVAYWHHLDYCLQSMLEIGGIVADIIFFHPYDGGHWGFDCMGCVYPTYSSCHKQKNTYNISNDLFYLQYLIARIASYRHVWYSIANEFDHIECKQKGFINASDGQAANKFPVWDQYFMTIIKEDVYDDMKEKSIHNGRVVYNYTQPWTTHLSLQGFSNVSYTFWQKYFNISKPVILDEEQYEGNITGHHFGLMTAAQETDRFWMGNANGNTVGHSESLLPNSTNDDDATAIMWWNLGNKLRGNSPDKIKWFGNYMRNNKVHPPFETMDTYCYNPIWNIDYGNYNVTQCSVAQLYQKGEFYLIYFMNGSTVTKISVEVGNSNVYEMSYIDYNATKITVIKNVSGPVIDVSVNKTPYNLQLVKISN